MKHPSKESHTKTFQVKLLGGEKNIFFLMEAVITKEWQSSKNNNCLQNDGSSKAVEEYNQKIERNANLNSVFSENTLQNKGK